MHFTICDYVFEIVQNAVESGASSVRIICDENSHNCVFVVEDNGCGMTEEQLATCRNPFITNSKKHPRRKMGFGIPFIIQCLETTGGQWHIDSKVGRGTRVEMRFSMRNIDTPPLGNLEDLWVSILCFGCEDDKKINFLIERTLEINEGEGKKGYQLDKNELSDMLGELNDIAAQVALKKYIHKLETDLCKPKTLVNICLKK